MSRKVFTAGEVLAAADVNNFLMNQSIMSFAGTASREASIPTPVEGMYTHLEDTDRLQFWDGSSWDNTLGLSLINDTTFTAQSTVSINDVFSSKFDNYKVVITTDLTTGTQSFLLRYRVAGADNTNATYTYQILDASSTSITGSRVVGATSHGIGTISAGSPNASEITIYNPNRAERTLYQSNGLGSGSNAYIRKDSGTFTATTQFTGFTIFPASSTITGRVQVYGMRK